MTVSDQFTRVRDAIAELSATTKLVAVSKTYDSEHIKPVLELGHRIFGENHGLELHLIGPLQSNKAAEAVSLFDVIQTIDRPKIATAIAAEIRKQGKTPHLFVQVNTGREAQKAGVLPEELPAILNLMRHDLTLKIEGLMCIPPVDDSAPKHFSLLRQLAREHGLTGLSMGMSGDYAEAIKEGATHVRVGSAIFGTRL